jgi:hypothetical protein
MGNLELSLQFCQRAFRNVYLLRIECIIFPVKPFTTKTQRILGDLVSWWWIQKRRFSSLTGIFSSLLPGRPGRLPRRHKIRADSTYCYLYYLFRCRMCFSTIIQSFQATDDGLSNVLDRLFLSFSLRMAPSLFWVCGRTPNIHHRLQRLIAPPVPKLQPVR